MMLKSSDKIINYNYQENNNFLPNMKKYINKFKNFKKNKEINTNDMNRKKSIPHNFFTNLDLQSNNTINYSSSHI